MSSTSPNARSTSSSNRCSGSYAAASRAASRARFELELLEKRDDINPNILEQARRQRAAAETRSQQLLRVIDALEDRLENE